MYFFNNIFAHAKFAAITYLAVFSGVTSVYTKDRGYNHNLPSTLPPQPPDQMTTESSFCPFNPSSILPFYQTTQELCQSSISHFSWQNRIDLDQLQREIARHIIYSPRLLAFYDNNANLLNEHTDTFVKRTTNEILKQKEFYCQLKSLLGDLNFKIELALTEYILGTSADARYYSGNNQHRIIISLHTWLGRYITDQAIVLNHELHHAFVTSQNKKKGAFDLFNAAPYNLTVIKTGEIFGGLEMSNPLVDKQPIKQAIQNCKEKVIRLANILAMPSNQINLEDQEFLKKFQKLTKNYKPRINIEKLEQYQLNIFKNQSYCEKIITNGYELESEKYTESVTRIFEIEEIAGVHYGYYKTYDGDDPLKAFLADIQRRINISDKQYKYDTLAYDVEFEAEFYGLLMPYPKLYDFLMPGIRQYYIYNNDEEFRHCIEDVTPL